MEEAVLKYGIIYLVSLLCLYICFKRFLYSIIDPLVQILLLFASLIAFASDHPLVFYIVFCIIAFWVGMYMVFPKSKIERNFSNIQITNVLNLKLYTYFLVFLYVGSILYVFAKSGIPLFSDNPTEAKISTFEGMGILRRISFIGTIIPINLIILMIISKKKRLFIFLLALFCILKIFQGSKSSLIGVILPLYYLFTQKNLMSLNSFKIRNRKTLYFLLGGIILGVLGYIVSKEAVLEGSTFIYSLGFRLMEFGDIALYYKDDSVQEYFQNYSALDYIGDELNGILGMLRIVPYKYPLGFLMVEQFNAYTPDVVVGPNGIFLIKGHIYFGYLGGIVYSMLCGYIFARIRKYYFSMEIKDIFWYALMTTVFFSLAGFLRESGQFYSLLFDIAFFTFPILFISQCLSKFYGRNVRIRRCI